MPSGKVHDRITVATAILSAPVWFFTEPVTTFPAYAAALSAYVFSGVMLSDDLDTKSVALKRWGALKFIWTPYRRIVPHRSWLSHGLVVGPLGRIVYIAVVVWVLARCVLWLVNEWLMRIDRDSILERVSVWIASALYHHSAWTVWCLWGLILGGIAHSLADWLWSGLKRAW